MTRVSRRATVLAACLALALLAGACGEDDSDSSSPGTDPPASSTGPGCTFDGGREPVELAPPTETLLLTDVRMAGHPCFDRIVFELEGVGPPGFEVGYLENPPTEDPTGNPVGVSGSVYLEIRMQSASGFDFDANAPSYTGPTRLNPSDTMYAREAVRTGDFEAILTWVVGLDEARDFSVSTLVDPTRVVVDVG
ncbi:MAG: AMIN-like domain-containing (lipo)protein [Actinomycetota bacterium]